MWSNYILYRLVDRFFVFQLENGQVKIESTEKISQYDKSLELLTQSTEHLIRFLNPNNDSDGEMKNFNAVTSDPL